MLSWVLSENVRGVIRCVVIVVVVMVGCRVPLGDESVRVHELLRSAHLQGKWV